MTSLSETGVCTIANPVFPNVLFAMMTSDFLDPVPILWLYVILLLLYLAALEVGY